MTGPIPSLPNVSFGNTATDVSSGVGSMIGGMLAQKQRQQTLAMQSALANANVQHLGAESGLETAQTGLVGQQEAKLGEYDSPVDTGTQQRLRGLGLPPEQTGGLTKGEALELESEHLRQRMMQMMFGARQSNTIISQFHAQDKAMGNQDAQSAYQNFQNLLSSGSAVAPYELVGSMARLALPNNARAVQVMINAMKQSGPLSGPFTPYENIRNIVGRFLTNDPMTGETTIRTTGMTLDPASIAELQKAAQAMAAPHAQMHHMLKQTAMNQAQAQGVNLNENELEDQDPWAGLNLGGAGQGNPNPTPGAPGSPRQGPVAKPASGNQYIP